MSTYAGVTKFQKQSGFLAYRRHNGYYTLQVRVAASDKIQSRNTNINRGSGKRRE